MRKNKDQYIGCILGGAIGDALGAPIEFMTADEIFKKYGPRGEQGYVEHSDEKAVLTAVNHSGDSDSTGAITGNLVGFLVGEQRIPDEWKRNLMYADIVREIGEDLHTGCPSGTFSLDKRWERKYPGY